MTRFKEGARIDRALETGRLPELRWALAYAKSRIGIAATERHRRHWEGIVRRVQACLQADQLIAEIRKRIQQERGASEAILTEIEDLVALFPHDPAVWVLRGDAIQLGDGTGPSLAEAKQSYQHALGLEPHHPEATEEIRRFIDVHGPDV